MNKKILIIEDEIPLLKSFVAECLKNKLIVEQALDGETGLKLAMADHPDLILLDLVLPKMDGLEMLRKLRADAWGAKAEVMILTNLSENKRVAEAMGLGAFEYLLKSDWDLNEVMTKIKKKLKVA